MGPDWVDMKTNHRRTNKGKFLVGYDYATLNFWALTGVGLSPTHKHGRVGAARRRREIKALRHRSERHRLNEINLDDLDDE